jgi:hypothetical protein
MRNTDKGEIMTTVKVVFAWNMYRPDNRQYKQQSIEVTPYMGDESPMVEIELPVELLANAEDYLKAGIEGKKPPQPILSVKAVKYLVDEWEKIFSDPKEVEPEDFFTKPTIEDKDGWVDKTDDWDTTPNEPKTNSEKATEQLNDNWDEVEKTETPDPVWDEKQEDWGTEPNFDN